MSRSGWSPLSVTGVQLFFSGAAVVDCALSLVAAKAAWGAAVPKVDNVIHLACRLGSLDAVERLLSAPGVSPDIACVPDGVRDVGDGDGI